jgi:hypothetical protein
MWDLAFWKATAQRVVRSFAASLVAFITAAQTDVISTDWENGFAVAGMAAVVTLLLSLAGGATNGSGPSFGAIETTNTPPPSTVGVE